jgi:hypothetical protein
MREAIIAKMQCPKPHALHNTANAQHCGCVTCHMRYTTTKVTPSQKEKLTNAI